MGVSGNPAIIMFDENKVAKTLEFVPGISHRTGVGGLDRFAELSFNVNAVVVASFTDCAVRRYDFAL